MNAIFSLCSEGADAKCAPYKCSAVQQISNIAICVSSEAEREPGLSLTGTYGVGASERRLALQIAVRSSSGCVLHQNSQPILHRIGDRDQRLVLT